MEAPSRAGGQACPNTVQGVRSQTQGEKIGREESLVPWSNLHKGRRTCARPASWEYGSLPHGTFR